MKEFLNLVVREDLEGILNIIDENFEGKCNPLVGFPLSRNCNTL